jgi:hypothetical protein
VNISTCLIKMGTYIENYYKCSLSFVIFLTCGKTCVDWCNISNKRVILSGYQ